VLTAEFVSGENSQLFSSLKIPHGEGLSGWVAQNHKAILNGNPSDRARLFERSHEVQYVALALAVPRKDQGQLRRC